MMKFEFGPIQIAMRAAHAVRHAGQHVCTPELVVDSQETMRRQRVSRSAHARRVAVARTLNAACTSCRGLGCGYCDGTGLD